MLQVIQAVEQATGRPVPRSAGARRAGDPASLVADVTKARELLGWSQQHSTLDRIVADAVTWERAPNYGQRGGKAR